MIQTNAITLVYIIALIITTTTMNYIGFGILLILFGLKLKLNKQLEDIRQLIIDWQNREIHRIKYEQE